MLKVVKFNLQNAYITQEAGLRILFLKATEYDTGYTYRKGFLFLFSANLQEIISLYQCKSKEKILSIRCH